MASTELAISEIMSITSLNDFLKRFKDENAVNQHIESITYDVKSQKVIIKMQELLKKETHNVERSHDKRTHRDKKIIQLSEKYRENFPELLKHFKAWKPVRENLVEILSSSSDKLERNFSIVSGIRIMTSAADIFGTMLRAGGKSETSLANFAMEHASTFGLLSLVTEKIMSKRMFKDVKKAIKSDQALFKKIVNWFKQTEELDNAVKSIFPYGIDSDIAKKIAKSASDSDDCNKIFMSIIASNVKENVSLFKDEEFLDKAGKFANSEAGKQWFQKLLLKDDPNLSHYLNSELNEDIQSILKVSATDDPSLYVDGCRMLSSKVKMKVTLNLITIMSAVTNLLFQNKPEQTDELKELSEKTQEELAGIQKIISCLKPSDLELEDGLL